MGMIIGALMAKGLSERMARIVFYAGLALILALAAVLMKSCNDKAVVQRERDRVEAAQAKADAEQAKSEREADARFNEEMGQAKSEAAARQERIDRESSKLPDKGVSPRQRLRVCDDLLRSNPNDRGVIAACGDPQGAP